MKLETSMIVFAINENGRIHEMSLREAIDGQNDMPGIYTMYTEKEEAEAASKLAIARLELINNLYKLDVRQISGLSEAVRNLVGDETPSD